MTREIPFTKVMKDPASWSDDMDLDIMTDNYLKLKEIMNKMFFEEYPKHPEYFVSLFSQPDFADNLLRVAVKAGIQNLNKIWFKEYSEEDKLKLVEKGILDVIPVMLDISSIVYTHNENDFYVGLFP
ncbi:MAG: hypothetical protein IJ215_04850 [Clostridia bacterium]|nr:hypothetical protein [Clostridia bacterium]